MIITGSNWLLQNICNADDAELVVNTLGKGVTTQMLSSHFAHAKEILLSIYPAVIDCQYCQLDKEFTTE